MRLNPEIHKIADQCGIPRSTVLLFILAEMNKDDIVIQKLKEVAITELEWSVINLNFFRDGPKGKELIYPLFEGASQEEFEDFLFELAFAGIKNFAPDQQSAQAFKSFKTQIIKRTGDFRMDCLVKVTLNYYQANEGLYRKKLTNFIQDEVLFHYMAAAPKKSKIEITDEDLANF